MPDTLVHDACRFLRSHTTAELRFDEHLRPLKYVMTHEGKMVTSVMIAMLESEDIELFIPEAQDEAMNLSITLVDFKDEGDDGAAADRWRIYHGKPDDLYWAYVEMDAARFEDSMIDGDALVRANALAVDESRVCRIMNKERQEDVKRLADRHADVIIDNPLMVGVDQWGFDLRGEFDVHRVHALHELSSGDEALAMIDQMLAG